MKRILILMAFSFFSLFSCKGYKDLTVNEFEAMLEQDQTVQLLDVRTPEEFAENHLPGALNIDWRGEGFSGKAQMLDKSRPVLVYCRSGRRSAEAAKVLDGLGFKTYNMKGGILAWTEAGKHVTKYEVERFWTASCAPVDITLIKHGTLAINYKDMTIHIDPVSGLGKPTDYATEFPKADVILITHEHGDHLDPEAIAAVSQGESTLLILNEKSRNQLGDGEAMHNGESHNLPLGIKLEAVPAYNTTPGREMFHPKGNGNGYVLTIDGLRIYVAGDTEDVSEMAELKDIDVAFLPVNQPYTMTPEQCIAAAKVIQPKVLIPYHFGQTDLSALPAALPGMDVRLRQMQ